MKTSATAERDKSAPGAGDNSEFACILGDPRTVADMSGPEFVDCPVWERARANLAANHQRDARLKQAQKIDALGHLTGGIAHDFNNLLAVILGNSEILCGAIEDPELREMADLIMSAAEQAAGLTERLLAFGRKQILSPESLDIGAIVDSLLVPSNSPVNDHISVTTSTYADRPAYADRGQLEAAILELVTNAGDAMPEGGTLKVDTNVVTVDEETDGGPSPGQYVCVAVTDSGAGMTEEVLEKAFDPFFTTKKLGRGAGMGLSMVYGFANQSGGHVSIESRSGDGTTVRLYLPVAQANKMAMHPSKPVHSTRKTGGSESILLVEDEPRIRRFVCDQLVGLGYEVLEAEAGAPALDILSTHPDIDLLFTDVMMPGGMSGFDLVKRARKVAPNLKVLMTTGYVAESSEIIGNVTEPILKKPYKRQQLAEALRSVLDQAA